MKPKDHQDFGWVGDVIGGFLDADSLEGVFWLVRLIGHGVFLGVRLVFHLLTCHF